MTIAQRPAFPELPPALHDLHRRMAEVAVESCPKGLGPVTGVGDPQSALCLVGEAPAEFEIREGRVLDDLLAHAGIQRAGVWLTNVVKCRTMRMVNGRMENRAPLVGELKTWLPLLDEELRIVKPKAIVCLGGTAAKALLGKTFKLTEQRGQWLDGPEGIKTMATFHPAFVLHLQQHDPDRSESTYDTVLDDLRAAKQAVLAAS
jgi:uracil-DNA glycosylase